MTAPQRRDKRKQEPCRAAPVFKRILRMGTSNTKREGRGRGERGGASPHPGARSTSQIGRNWGEAAWP